MFTNDTDASVTDYENDFYRFLKIMVKTTLSKGARLSSNICHRIIQWFEFPQNINLALSEFTSVASLSRFNNNSQEGIRLAEAINIYIADINGADTNSAITSEANTFVQSQNPRRWSIWWQWSDSYSGNIDSWRKFVAKKIFLLTIEFSDTSDTYYSFDHTDSGIDYYNKSITGNSNVYQNLEFVINKLEITTINE